MTAIITYIPANTEIEFCVRAMRNVDEQSTRAWHHFLLCETEEMLKRVRSLIPLLSAEYDEQMTAILGDEIDRSTYGEIQKTHRYIAIHPVRDFWTPDFIELMTSKLENSPVIIAGVWCRYATVYEAIRHKAISIDRSEPEPEIDERLLLPSLNDLERACHIQGLYYSDALPESERILHIHPLALASHIIVESDIMAVPEMKASFSMRGTVRENALQLQQVRNQIYRTHPLLRMKHG